MPRVCIKCPSHWRRGDICQPSRDSQLITPAVCPRLCELATLWHSKHCAEVTLRQHHLTSLPRTKSDTQRQGRLVVHHTRTTCYAPLAELTFHNRQDASLPFFSPLLPSLCHDLLSMFLSSFASPGNLSAIQSLTPGKTTKVKLIDIPAGMKTHSRTICGRRGYHCEVDHGMKTGTPPQQRREGVKRCVVWLGSTNLPCKGERGPRHVPRRHTEDKKMGTQPAQLHEGYGSNQERSQRNIAIHP